jgi:hypothetical protein
MAQVEVRLSRKLYRSGESTDARINREIQMASLCTCSVGEITTKLVSRMRLVTPHMVRATNMRIIVCFMIFLSLCNRRSPCPLDFASDTILTFSKRNTHLAAILFRAVTFR